MPTLTRAKAVTGGLLALTLAGLGAGQVGTSASEEARFERAFRVTVDEVLAEHGTIVSRIEIETRPGLMVKVVADKANRGGGSVGTPARPGAPSRTQMIIFADQVQLVAGATNGLKFIMKLTGAGAATMTTTGPMPGGKALKDVLKIAIKSGEYEYGEPTKLVTYDDVTYNLVVDEPK